MKKSRILTEISQCFKDTKLPKGARLICSDYLSIYEAVEVGKLFAPYSWEEITTEILLTNKAVLNYFSNKAFVYFLPAYLKLIILDFEEVDVLVNILINKLTLPSLIDLQKEYIDYLRDENKRVNLEKYYEEELKMNDDKIHAFIERTALLTFEQSQCILNFLMYLQKHFSGYFEDDILHRAIYRYWFKFC